MLYRPRARRTLEALGSRVGRKLTDRFALTLGGLSLSLVIATGGLLFVLLGGLAGFRVLTRRLRALSASMDDFWRQHLAAGNGADGGEKRPRGDELDELAASFEEMARRISEQMQQLEEKEQRRFLRVFLEMPALKRGSFVQTRSTESRSAAARGRGRRNQARRRCS